MSLESEFARISSFKSWEHPGQPLRLARRGFYYEGKGRSVACYQCRLDFEDWQDLEELLAIHRVRSPGCILSSAGSEDGRREDTVRNSANSTRDETDFTVPASQQAKFENTSLNLARRDTVENKPAATADPNIDQLRVERVRLETFHNWPHTAARVVDPRDLAEAGLFYTGQGDRVQCAFCRGFLRNWIRGDKPADEHRKHFPDCPFVRELDVGNVRYVETASDVRSRSHPAPRISADAVNQSLAAGGVVNLTETPLGAREPDRQNARSAKHPRYAELASRVESYRGKRVGNGQTVAILAQAGFFHVGPEDNVRCFQCDGGLKNWQPTDDPWTEHARWFPRCPHLLANKDQQFIRDAQIVRNDVPNHTFQHTSTSTASRGRYHVEPREIKARMDSATVQAVINMGYRRELVRQVIERRLTTTGDDFPNTQSLLEAVFEMEDDPSLQQDSNQTDFSNSSSVSTLRNSVSFQSTAASVKSVSTSFATNDERLSTSTPNAQDPEAQAVLDENRRLREARTCSVCMDKEVNTVFLPCGHLVCCNECSQSLTNCAVCRALIRGTVKIFLS